jgi:hypothetical protein
MSSRSVPLCFLTVIAVAGAEAGGRSLRAQADPAKNGYNACRLLKQDELNVLTEKKVLLASVEEASPERSVCIWEDSAGPVFKLTVYWTGGRQGWETWRASQKMGGAAISKAEGVHPDSVIKQGAVPGLGDAAYFSELLPSLLLKKDTLFEMEMSLVPHPERKFRGLATALLSRI